MNSFEYAAPSDVESVLGLLGDRFGEVEILAGGTDLVTSLKQGLVSPKRLVSLKGIRRLRGIEKSGDVVRIGATTPLVDLHENAVVRKEFPSLVQAIAGIGSPQIINMGTIGGDLCQRPRCWYYRQGFGLLGQLDGKSLIPEGDNRYHAIFDNAGPAYFVNPSLLAPALTALGATLEIAGPKSTRQLAMGEFFRKPRTAEERENVLAPNEIITQVTIRVTDLANAIYEVRPRQGLDWPLVAAAVALPRYKGGMAQIVLGHVAPVPWRVPKAAAVLAGRVPDDEMATRAGDAAAEGATPLSGNAYKVRLVKTAVKRAILAVAEKMRA